MSLDEDEAIALFEKCRRSAFRLETLQVYTIPSERATFEKFLAGEQMPDGFNAGWNSLVRTWVAAGKTIQRAKIVRRPLTDYTRYLLSWGVPRNSAAGEDYRILDLTDRSADLPGQDFWLFDDETVMLLDFRSDGTLRGRELADPADLDQYRHWRDRALAEAVPWSEYRLQRPLSGQ